VKLLLNFANEKYRESQQLNSQTGREIGRFDHVVSCGPSDIAAEFTRRHWRILWQDRGAGYWLWKPYFILRTLESLNDGDWLFYCDSGAFFLTSIDPLIETCRVSDQDVLTFGITVIEKEFTKRDAFLLLDADTPQFTDSVQRLGGFSLWRKSPAALELARDWLRFATDERALTDCPNRLGLPNYEGFRQHRHDQSLLSLLAKRRGLPAFRDPSQFGNGFEGQYPNSPYPQLVELTRAKTRASLWRKAVRQSQRWVRSAALLWPAA
jgi:hypothetical protein